jgi:hypothetical protein
MGYANRIHACNGPCRHNADRNRNTLQQITSTHTFRIQFIASILFVIHGVTPSSSVLGSLENHRLDLAGWYGVEAGLVWHDLLEYLAEITQCRGKFISSPFSPPFFVTAKHPS